LSVRAGRILKAWAEARGYRVAGAEVSALDEVRKTLEDRRAKGEVDDRFYRDNLSDLTYLDGCRVGRPRSVLLAAVPRPAHLLAFSAGGKALETILPPTYVLYRKFFEDVRSDLEQAMSGLSLRLELLSAPLKALGNAAGLLSYGRNNLGYVEGMGSYVQLVGLVSDLPLEGWDLPERAPKGLLVRCEKCRACVKACPTGAISLDRVLLRAEKCYTVFSESAEPIPPGLDPPSPRCLVGCLKCQEVCPENKGRLKTERAGLFFSETETSDFLRVARGSKDLLSWARDTLRPLGLSGDVFIFARNLEKILALQGPTMS
jgi:epoxyqueuosine reductase